MTHDELCLLGMKWLRRKGRSRDWHEMRADPEGALKVQYCCGCMIAAVEVQCGSERADVFGVSCTGHTELVEVKVSRGDFLRDGHKFQRLHRGCGVGRARWYLTPPDVIRDGDDLRGFGHVVVMPRGLKVLQWSRYFDPNPVYEMQAMVQLLRIASNDAPERQIGRLRYSIEPWHGQVVTVPE